MKTPPAMEKLVASLKRLPGIGEKSATRLAFFLLSAPERMVSELADSIMRVKTEIVLCEHCFDLTEASPCPICNDERRDPALLCVVEEPADLAAVERSGDWRGRYFVLGGALSPIDGVGPNALRVGELEKRVKQDAVREILIATNPNAEGDATAHFLAERLRSSGARITRIGYGMPMGGDLEYTDHETIGRSLKNRSVLE